MMQFPILRKSVQLNRSLLFHFIIFVFLWHFFHLLVPHSMCHKYIYICIHFKVKRLELSFSFVQSHKNARHSDKIQSVLLIFFSLVPIEFSDLFGFREKLQLATLIRLTVVEQQTNDEKKELLLIRNAKMSTSRQLSVCEVNMNCIEIITINLLVSQSSFGCRKYSSTTYSINWTHTSP